MGLPLMRAVKQQFDPLSLLSPAGGGIVVKNVAGYDLPRLLTGSFGSLPQRPDTRRKRRVGRRAAPVRTSTQCSCCGVRSIPQVSATRERSFRLPACAEKYPARTDSTRRNAQDTECDQFTWRID
jgi:hypothetical protein